ncbi:carbon-nitrogen hydrolase family protein [Sporomusa termitida]|uniref:Deaminated glutathione amidase n=1 Tax=Sporomusa termitida TaxID=2377 RepID=A0A517DXP9_9FIRM|nr:carbon-nitrogen hydrolase family protein [Sporomusa termitida]QDR82134.1 Deaminated glutathione amidase [Sporomusa termitida]
MSVFTVGICQMGVVPDKLVNLDRARQMIGEATARGSRLVVLPEMFNCPYQSDLFPEYAESFQDGPTVAMLAECAAKYQVIVVGGSIPERDEAGNIYNTSFIFDERGALIGRHRKIHLFDIAIKGGTMFQESRTLAAGSSMTVVRTSLGTMGVAICYDVRFPELARAMTLAGARILIYPAAFGPVTGPAHWELLMRSRAVDNQVYVVAAAPALNAAAEYEAHGHSMLVDPWARVLAVASEVETVITGKIDFRTTDKVREELPLLKHRRPEIYRD